MAHSSWDTLYNGSLIITSENNLNPSGILLRRNPGKTKMLNR